MPSNPAARKKATISPFSVPHAARTFAQGLSYASSDEIEAYLRTLLSKDPKAYELERNRIRAEIDAYAQENPKAAFGLEATGMVGSALATPQLTAAKALGPLGRFLVGGAEDAAQGALYAVGNAKDRADIPRSIREEAPVNAIYYTGAAGVGAGTKAAGRAAAKQILSTRRGYETALQLQRLLSKFGM